MFCPVNVGAAIVPDELIAVPVFNKVNAEVEGRFNPVGDIVNANIDFGDNVILPPIDAGVEKAKSLLFSGEKLFTKRCPVLSVRFVDILALPKVATFRILTFNVPVIFKSVYVGIYYTFK